MTQSVSVFGLGGAFGLALVPVIAPAAEQPGVWQMHDEHVLGAPANFIVTAMDDDHAMAAVSAARAEIDRLDQIFNSRRQGSELVALNHAEAMVVSPELFEVLSRAEAMREASGGAYSGRLGAVLTLWREAADVAPDAAVLQRAALAANGAVVLDPATRLVRRPAGVAFALDGVAKGYIVDRALQAGLAAAPVKGMLVDIGGDMRCQGLAPQGGVWTVGIPDPAQPLENAPLVAQAHLKDKAIATSGRGPRDRVLGGQAFSATISPQTGWSMDRNIAATVIADSAAEADALATALLVMDARDGLALAERTPGGEARITDAFGRAHTTRGWRKVASEPPVRLIRVADPVPAAPTKWQPDWAVEMIYSAPEKSVDQRQRDFRTPYMAMWITDKQNRPIRTLVLIGTSKEWQRDNFIWWGMYKDRAAKLVELRSTATQLSGRYPTYWPGYNDDWKFVPQGEYVLHIETSRERGKHTYRTVPMILGKAGFSTRVTPTEEGGGLQLTYGKRD